MWHQPEMELFYHRVSELERGDEGVETRYELNEKENPIS